MAASTKRRAVQGSGEGSGSAAVAAASDWRDAITFSPGEPLKLLWVAPEQLDENPANWRLHPDAQMQSLNEVLADVGWAGAALYNLETRQLVDGHARKKAAKPGVPMPVLVGRWTREQEKKILLTLDPIASMAKADEPKLKALLDSSPVQQADLRKMLDDLTVSVAAGAGQAAAAAAAAPKAETEDEQDGVNVVESYGVLIKCGSESDQLEVLRGLEKFPELETRALTVAFPEPERVEPAPVKLSTTGRTIRREVKVLQTPRVKQLAGLYDVPSEKKSSRVWHVDLHLEEKPWQIGLIVGPSGSGKSTIARELFGDRLVNGWPWPDEQSVLDGFPEGMGIADITALLSSVGFSSAPSWRKPFHVLSNGEKFRVELARTLAEAADLAVVDEFTSVVDRQVAQIGSAALAKTVRSTGRRFVAVGCHYDVIDWLQPDWVVDLGKTDDQHRVKLEWRSLRRRPEIQLSIRRAGAGEWPRFREHHYLSGKLHRSAKCFVAEVDGQAAAFAAVLWYPHHNSVQGGWYREHRVVCLPDYQGVGIGNRLSELIASIYAATGKSYRSRTSHPSMIWHRTRSRLWRLLAQPAMTAPTSGSTRKSASFNRSIAGTRMTAGFEYVGPARPDDARALGLRL